MGEAPPFTPRHIDDGWQGTPQSKQMEHPPSFNVRNNIYVTTSANCSLEALLCALLAVNADHILFSTDYLYAPLDRLSRCIGTAPIGETDQEKTCHLTAYFIDLGQVANARDYP